ncbi:MAG: hypothetical protein MUO31_14880 [Thermodesulfovibrionales bacterium]|nr:hypothetical protein [Thermodesulfovibrionales bacterium]
MTRKVEKEKTGDSTFDSYTTQYVYNSFNKVEKLTENAGTAQEALTTFFYDERGNLSGSIDAEGHKIYHEYDSFGRKTKTTRELESGDKLITQFAYDAGNNLVSITDANNNITRYEYDTVFKRNWLTKVIYPDNTFSEYTYDLNGNVLTEKQRNGTLVTNTYNDLNLLANRSIQPAAGVLDTTGETYEYDGASRLTKATDNDSTVIFGYDSLNRRTSENQNGKLINYTYDKVNNLTSIQYPNQRIIEREFDVLTRINKIKQGGTQIANMEFLGRTYRMLSKGYQNGDVVKYLYDQGRRMTGIEAKDRNAAIINQYAYGYNKVNLKNYEHRLHDTGKGDIYAYDAVNRLTEARINCADPLQPNPPAEKVKTFNLDKIDNILKITANENGVNTDTLTTMSTNAAKLNQYTTFDQWALAHDGNGNLTQRGTQQFGYNFRNRLVQGKDGTNTFNYKYDVFGRQVEKSGSSDTRRYYYAGDQKIEERDGSDNVTRQYIWGNGIDELLRIDRNENGAMVPYYVHTNEIGSTTAITDANGMLIERVSYDVYGVPSFTNTSGQAVAASTIGNAILFQGHELDFDLNLYNYRARFYDPIMGRFTTVDPLGYVDSMNLYQGMNMNPGNYVDPMGMWMTATHSSITKKVFNDKEELIYQALNKKLGYSEKDCRRMMLPIEFNLIDGSNLPDFGYDNYNLVENQGEQFHAMYNNFDGGPSAFRNLIINTAFSNIINAKKKFFNESGPSTVRDVEKIHGAMLLGEVLHMIQDTYAPAHVKRDEGMKIKYFQNYKEQNNKILGIIPTLKHQWDDTYDKEHKELYFEAVRASEKILELFFSNGANLEAELLRVLNDIMSHDFSDVISKR